MKNTDKMGNTLTRTDKLDTLLNGLLYIDKRLLAGEKLSKEITIEFLCDTLKLDCEQWEMLSLRKELINDGHAIDIDGEMRITENGKIFITRHKGFKNLVKKQKEEEVIREKTIEKIRYDKLSFWLSILAILISGLSLLLSIVNNQ